MGNTYSEVKDNTYGCEVFTDMSLYGLTETINKYLSEPLKENRNYRLVPIDLCLATEVLPQVTYIGEIADVYNKVNYNVVLIYEKIYDTQ